MIVDNILNCDKYSNIHSEFEKAFNWLKNNNLQDLLPGKYVIDGDNLYASVSQYNTKSLKEGRLEAHKEYIDIQYIISGQEYIGWEYLQNQPETIAYDKDKDLVFYRESAPTLFPLKEGYFAIFFPYDLHMPCIEIEKAQPMHKVVIKVKL
jgi:YhcH/YjgK/YiaL family protein